MEEGVFYSKMVFKSPTNKIVMDARTSDAVALAIRFNAPIYMSIDVLEKAGIILDKEEKPKALTKVKKETKSAKMAKIKKALENAIKKEDYEKAALLKQQLNDLEKPLDE